jgi:hypothetical protein
MPAATAAMPATTAPVTQAPESQAPATRTAAPERSPAASPARGGTLAGAAAVLVVASVVPLALLQLPNLIGSSMSAATMARIAGPNGAADLIRASGLALPVMACVAPVAAVLARRHRAWPSLLTGLILLGAADLLGDSARSVLLIAIDRGLHGLGAGIALPATLALAWERSPWWRRLLCRWWTVVLVLSLLGSVPLLRDRLTSGGWRAALQPFPWLTAVALAVTALYIALTGGAGPPARAAVTPAERSQLALLAAPAAGLSVLAVGVSDQLASSVVAAAAVAVFVLACMAMVTSADAVTGGERGTRGRLCFPLVGACAGFVLAPTAGAISTLRSLAAGPDPALRALGIPLAAAAAACLLGTGIAWLLRTGAGSGDVAATAGTLSPGCADGEARRAGAHAARHKARSSARPGQGARAGQGAAGPAGQAALRCVVAGLACAAAGLLAARAAGPNGSQAELAGAYALLAGGLAMALSASIAAAPPAGAMAGLSLALVGALIGYLAAAAIQIRLLGSAASATAGAAAAHAAATAHAATADSALTRVAGSWELVAAAAAAVAAAAALFIGRARRRKGEVPVRG